MRGMLSSMGNHTEADDDAPTQAEIAAAAKQMRDLHSGHAQAVDGTRAAIAQSRRPIERASAPYLMIQPNRNQR
jgi:hypothetical protein